MGCSGPGSKTENLPLVGRQRERRDLIRAAATKLAFAHFSYFQSLKGVGDALQKFVDEELITVESSPSSPTQDEVHFEDDDTDSHLHLTDSSSEDYAHHFHDSEEDDTYQHHHNIPRNNQPYSNSHHYPNLNEHDTHRPYDDPQMSHWGPQAAARHYPNYTNVHCMKKGAPAAHTVIQEPPPEPSYGYSDSYFYPGAGSGSDEYVSNENVRVNQEKDYPPPPPSPPKASTWDFFNPFDEVNTNEYYSSGRYGYRSDSSSPNSTRVWEREGIPDFSRKFPLLKKRKNNGKLKKVPMVNSESSSKSVSSMSSEENVKIEKGTNDAKKMYTPSQPSVLSPHLEGTPCVVGSPSGEVDSSIGLTDGSSSPEIFVMQNIANREGVSFEVGLASGQEEGDPSKLSSVPLSSPRGNRDLKEAVAEIRDEFHTAASYGKEVAVMLEVGKMPSFFKAILSQILYPISSSMRSAKLASKTKKLAKTYFDDVGKDEKTKACNLSSTLDKLYTCEKQLYKKVKEKLKRLKYLDPKGVAQTHEKQLQKKLDDKINEILTKIYKLRNEELQPQVVALIHGLIKMWKAMFKCHQKQFKVLMESKVRRLKTNTSLQTNPTSRATAELECELHAWCDRFNKWISSQKSYVESLNGWFLLEYDPEVTPNRPVPYPPGHLGAPPVFVICNDWQQQMNAVSEVKVTNAMDTFTKTLRELREKDDLKVDLDSMGHTLIEEKEKHKDAMNSVHEAAWRDLFPIFKALEVFTSEALKAHEQVRLQQPGLGSY